MTIPSLFVDSVVEERTKRAKDVIGEISGRAGGPQTFLGPSLSIPYSIPPLSKGASPTLGVYVVFPAKGDASIKVRTEERRRSLFKVPVYQAELKFDATFDLTGVPSAAPAGAELDWTRAGIVIGASDARGALADGTLTVKGKTSTFVPAENVGDENPRLPLTYFGVRVPDLAKPNGTFDLTANLRFSGAQRLAVLAYGKSTRLVVEGDWPSPGFDGGFLPVKHSVSSQGFTGEWSVPFIARGIPAEGATYSVSALDHTALGISFIEVADPYQSVSRSLKYSLLFIGLLFLSYFVFEATAGKRVHPAQYVLVGTAQVIFYLLLLSLAERIGFDWGFLIAGFRHGASAFGECSMDFCKPRGGPSRSVCIQLALLFHLSVTATGRQRPSGRRSGEFSRRGCGDVFHAQHRLVQFDTSRRRAAVRGGRQRCVERSGAHAGG